MRARSRDLDAAIADRASMQLRLISSAQLGELGLDGTGIARRVKRRALTRVLRGVYTAGPALMTDDMLAMAGVLAAGGSAVVDGQAAGALRGLLPENRGFVTVSRPGRGRPTRLRTSIPMADGGYGLVELRHRSFREDEYGRVGVCPVASTERILLELAALRDDELFLDAWRQAEYLRSLDLAALKLQLERGTRPGQDRLRRHLESFRELELGRHGVDSPAELAAIRMVVEAGAPPPLVNHWIETPGGARARRRLDLYWELARLAVEIDGWGAHGTRSAFEDDRVRDSDLLAIGIVTARYSARRLDIQPDWCATRILDLIAARTQG